MHAHPELLLYLLQLLSHALADRHAPGMHLDLCIIEKPSLKAPKRLMLYLRCSCLKPEGLVR